MAAWPNPRSTGWPSPSSCSRRDGSCAKRDFDANTRTGRNNRSRTLFPLGSANGPVRLTATPPVGPARSPASLVIELERALRKACADLDAIEYAYALVGGLAVSARAEPRFTRDADLAIAVRSDQEAEAAVLALQARGYAVLAVVEQDATRRLAAVRLRGADPSTIVDLLFASSGVEPEIVAQAEPMSIFPGFTLPVARTGHLLAMKLLARDDRHRPADADDLRALREVAGDPDWELASLAVKQITERGYERGRDLAGALAHLRIHGAY